MESPEIARALCSASFQLAGLKHAAAQVAARFNGYFLRANVHQEARNDIPKNTSKPMSPITPTIIKGIRLSIELLNPQFSRGFLVVFMALPAQTRYLLTYGETNA